MQIFIINQLKDILDNLEELGRKTIPTPDRFCFVENYDFTGIDGFLWFSDVRDFVSYLVLRPLQRLEWVSEDDHQDVINNLMMSQIFDTAYKLRLDENRLLTPHALEEYQATLDLQEKELIVLDDAAFGKKERPVKFWIGTGAELMSSATIGASHVRAKFWKSFCNALQIPDWKDNSDRYLFRIFPPKRKTIATFKKTLRSLEGYSNPGLYPIAPDMAYPFFMWISLQQFDFLSSEDWDELLESTLDLYENGDCWEADILGKYGKIMNLLGLRYHMKEDEDFNDDDEDSNEDFDEDDEDYEEETQDEEIYADVGEDKITGVRSDEKAPDEMPVDQPGTHDPLIEETPPTPAQTFVPPDIPNPNRQALPEIDHINIAQSLLPGKQNKELFALEVEGGSMEGGTYQNGDIIIMRWVDKVPVNGSLGFVTPKEGNLSLGYIFQHEDGISVKSMSGSLPPVFYAFEDLVPNKYAIVVQVIRRFNTSNI